MESSGRTVRDAMTAAPKSISSDATVVEAARTMTEENVGSLPVVEGNELVGMVTDRDLVVQIIAQHLNPGEVSVGEVKSRQPVTAAPDEPLHTALQRMAQEQVRRLPVVEGGRLVGILAQADVALAADETATGEMVEEISRH